jgi:hypothetical protein
LGNVQRPNSTAADWFIALARYRIERKDGRFVVHVTDEDGHVSVSPPFLTKSLAEMWIVEQTMNEMLHTDRLNQ